MSCTRTARLAALFAVLAGCSATPNLEYRSPRPDYDGFMKFTLPQSAVVLKAGSGTINATVVTDDSYPGADRYSLMVDARQTLLTSTTVTKFKFVSNQNVVESIATTASSNIPKLLGLAKDVISSAASTSPDPATAFQDDVIDPFAGKDGQPIALPVNRDDLDCKLQRNPGWNCRISIGAYRPWVIPFTEFRHRALSGEMPKVFPTAACVRAVIRLTAPAGVDTSRLTLPGRAGSAGDLGSMPGPGDSGRAANPVDKPAGMAPEELMIEVELADPSHVNLTRLRAGGELLASGACRMDVTNDQADSNLQTESFTAALEVFKAYKARKATK